MTRFAENGIHMFLWIGLGANPNFVQQVFGAPSAIQVNIETVALPELDNPLSLAVRTIVEEIRIQRHKCMRVRRQLNFTRLYVLLFGFS